MAFVGFDGEDAGFATADAVGCPWARGGGCWHCDGVVVEEEGIGVLAAKCALHCSMVQSIKL